MIRRVWPQAFVLSAGELIDAHNTGRTEKVAREFVPKPPKELGPAVALRWSSNPVIGIPRVPFEVWRRPREFQPDRELIGEVRVDDRETITWPEGEMYEIRFQADPDAGRTLVIRAIDARREAIPGQQITVSSSQLCAIRCVGIAGIDVFGSGQIKDVFGIDQHDFVNGGGWQRTEVVGLPYKFGEEPTAVYDTNIKQGYEPPAHPGIDAARIRLEIMRQMTLPLPDTGDPQVPTPSWPEVDPGAFVDSIRDPQLAPLRLISKCLNESNDSDLAKLQVKYVFSDRIDGIQQLEPPSPPGEPADVNVPVVGTTMVNVSADSDAASGLGYGCVDFPPFSRDQNELTWPPGAAPTPFDYMVTGRFVLPFLGDIELAALAETRPPATPAIGLDAETLQGNRAPGRDLPETKVVELSWALPLHAQSYAVVASHNPGTSEVLNIKRPTGAYEPFILQRPRAAEGTPPADLRGTFITPRVTVPFSGANTSRYKVMARDVFARWSSWRSRDHVVSAPPVTKPGLQGAEIETDVATAIGHVVPSTIHIRFAWDFTDRSLARVVFTGRFFTGDDPPVSFTGGFGLSSSSSFDPAVEVTFDAAGNPTISSSHVGSVIEVIQDPHDVDRRVYRLSVEGLSCDFTSLSKLRYAVYARAAETVRPSELSNIVAQGSPSAESAGGGPVVAVVADPVPADAPEMPIDIQWTAFPDPTGVARAVLSWPSKPGASGYFVWEATEVALRHAVDPSAPDPAPGTPIINRAGALRALVTANATNQARSLIAFSRMNERKTTATSMEIALPAAADSLYAYRVSSVTSSGVESDRSATVALLAVPRLDTPTQPRLLLRKVTTPVPGVDVHAVDGAGNPPTGYRVHRVRRAAAAADIGSMGPAHITESDPDWTPTATNLGAGRSVFDAVTPSWYPYYYRVVAVGQHAPASGVYRGESLPSGAQSIVVPPPAAPLIDNITLTPSSSAPASNRVLSFRTDLPVKRSPLGAAQLRLTQSVPNSDGTRMQRVVIVELSATEVAEGPPFAVIAAPTQAELEAMPEISRGTPDNNGRAVYSVRMLGEVTRGVITVTDPLGRSAEATFSVDP